MGKTVLIHEWKFYLDPKTYAPLTTDEGPTVGTTTKRSPIPTWIELIINRFNLYLFSTPKNDRRLHTQLLRYALDPTSRNGVLDEEPKLFLKTSTGVSGARTS